MDQESAAASAGSLISLNEHEQRYYSGLHALCQAAAAAADAPGKLSSSKVAELFKASQLPPECLHKVTEVCGAKHLGYFGTPQFYVALKLLAAAQSGLPVRLESITANLPLPRFAGLKNEPEMRYTVAPSSTDAPAALCGLAPGSVPWTPAERSTFRHQDISADKKELWSPPHSPCSSPPRSPQTYCSYPYTKQRNGVDPQITSESLSCPRPIVQLEQHSSPSHYLSNPSVEHPAKLQTSSERLGQQSTVDYSDDDPWRITAEQLEYYTNQFKSLQPDLGALILGAVVKNFFTKSKLPIPELSHIWELSDVDRDGALTFTEFCIAFHLIVARKNGYPLPESLPPTLQPGFVQQEEDVPDTPESSEPLIVFEDAEPRPCPRERSFAERLQLSSGTSKQEQEEKSIEEDLGVKSSAQDKQTLQLGEFPERPELLHELDSQMRTKTRPRSYSSTSIEDAMKKAEEPPTPPPRPQKTHSRASSLDLNKLLQQGTPGVKSGWLLPPALPPRPSTSQVPHFLNVSDKVSQNKVQQPNFADFSHFREEEESTVKPEDQAPGSTFGPSTEDLNSSKQDTSGASHNQVPPKPIRRKYHPEGQNLETGPPPAMPLPPPARPSQKLLSRQKREIQMAIRKNRETNAVLTRLNSELQQQLKVVHKERVTLESQLELLRPLAST
ncbi:ralBP1-associated Eps domain-containing protein 2 isoform X2 [Austrofundulus limnaeus]|uniref:RalBP1-associated Eps domain-containing protein 2 isoform X2 n=1 Tax=Austrofundulus limnaeus TaxID=52670 RepID=A0A2I4ALP7_AUSLI|nr:PREDICTED: ralBP1-associated Eps domain-containing protein 2 isoform X2 [Austrofundulus limnaeus]